MKIVITKLEVTSAVEVLNKIIGLVAGIHGFAGKGRQVSGNLKETTKKILNTKVQEDGDYEINITPEFFVDSVNFLYSAISMYIPLLVSVFASVKMYNGSLKTQAVSVFSKWQEDLTPEQEAAKKEYEAQAAHAESTKNESYEERKLREVKETTELAQQRLLTVKSEVESVGNNFVGEKGGKVNVIGLVAYISGSSSTKYHIGAIVKNEKRKGSVTVYPLYQGAGCYIVEDNNYEFQLKTMAADPVKLHNADEYKEIVGIEMYGGITFESLRDEAMLEKSSNPTEDMED